MAPSLRTLLLDDLPAPLLLAALSVRLASSLLTLTYAAPDEYWQGPEVAHWLVFGVGARTWEWGASAALRSFTHPLLLAVLAYAPVRALEAVGALALPTPWLRTHFAQGLALPLLWLAPRLVHAALTLLCDLATFALALRAHGPHVASLALCAQLCNFFSLFAGARPLSNGLEASLCTTALLLWRQALAAEELLAVAQRKEGSSRGASARPGTVLCGVLAGLAFAVRPTAAIYWALVAACALGRVGPAGLWRVGVARGALPAALATLALTAALDSTLYGAPTLPWLNFFTANALSGVGSLYGTHGAAWYLYSGLPMLLGAQLLPLLLSLLLMGGAPWESREGLFIAAGFTAALSCIAHKEHRFLLPILPLLSIEVARGLWGAAPFLGLSAGPLRSRQQVQPPPRLWLAAALGIPALASAAAALYLNTVHQRGSVAVAEDLARDAAAAAASANASALPFAVHLLLPCHATPLFSHLHYDVEALGLDCHPASMLGHAGGGFLEGLCATGGCCGPWGGGGEGGGPLPGLWEAKALEVSPLGLIRSAYGWHQQQQLLPRACRRLGGAGEGEGEEAAWEGPFLTSPALFVEEFSMSIPGSCGGQGAAAGARGSGPLASALRRRLPSHLVLRDVEAEAEGVAAWLVGAGFSLHRAYPQGSIKGDSHAGLHSKKVHLYKHACWEAREK